MADQIVSQYVIETQQAVAGLNEVNAKLTANDKVITKTSEDFTKQNKVIETNIRSIQSLNIQAQSYQKIIQSATDPKRIVEYNKKLEETKKQLEQTANIGKKGFDELGNKIKTTDGFLGKMTASLKGIVGALGIAFGVQQLISFGKEAVLAAAKIEGIRVAFNKIGNEGFLEELRTATRNTVSDFELMRLAVNANNFQIPLENFGTLLKFAQQRARETGESVDYLVNSITLGIARRSPLILDNLGINIKRIREEFQLTGDFSTAALKIINEELDKQGTLALTTADRIDQFSAKWVNFKVKAGGALITTFDLLGGIFTQFYNLDNLKPIENGLNKPIIESTKSIQKQVISLDSLRSELELYTDILNKSAIGSKDFSDAQKEILRVQNEIDEATGKNAQKRRQDAEKEQKMLQDIADQQIPGGLNSGAQREDAALKERNEKRLESTEEYVDSEYRILKEQQESHN